MFISILYFQACLVYSVVLKEKERKACICFINADSNWWLQFVTLSTYICSTLQKFHWKLFYKQCHNICSWWNKYPIPFIPLGTFTIILIPVGIIFQNTFCICNLCYEGTSISWQIFKFRFHIWKRKNLCHFV